MGGLLTPTAGTVEVFGKPVTGPMPQDIAFVFQENALFPWNTVSENVDLGMRFQGVPKSERAERARRSLEAVGLKDFADHFPGQLSGGMRQRAALARALSLQTGILLMDEPFGALDAMTRQGLQDEVLRIVGERRTTVLFVTHDLDEALYLGDRLIVLAANPGRIARTLDVALPRPRNQLATRENPEFLRLRRDLFTTMQEMGA
jgi:NitT/TauT family transport system ATP-binding protein